MSAARTLLVLGGGGAMGAYQAGSMHALAAAGVLPDALFGCSAGGLNAAFWAVDPSVSRADELRQWWTDPVTHRLLSASWFARARGTAGALYRPALLAAAPLRRLIADHVPAHDLGELRVPLTVTTTCLDCAAPRHHDRGPLVDTLAASCALPGLLPPVRLPDGHLHVDGGVLCGVPLSAALAAAGPADRLLVLDCGLAPVTSAHASCAALPSSPANIGGCGLGRSAGRTYVAPTEIGRGAMDVVLRAFTVARAVANLADVTPGLRDPRVHVLPHIADAWAAGVLAELPAGPRDFRRTGELMRAGAGATRRWLDEGRLEDDRLVVPARIEGLASA